MILSLLAGFSGLLCLGYWTRKDLKQNQFNALQLVPFLLPAFAAGLPEVSSVLAPAAALIGWRKGVFRTGDVYLAALFGSYFPGWQNFFLLVFCTGLYLYMLRLKEEESDWVAFAPATFAAYTAALFQQVVTYLVM